MNANTRHRAPWAAGAALSLTAGALAAVAPAPAPAAAPARPSAVVVAGTLTITGTYAADVITVDYTGADRVVVGLGGRTRSFPREEIDEVLVRLGRGDDDFQTVAAIPPQLDLPMDIRTGAGDDVVLAGNRSDTIVGGAGDDALFGLGGIDLLRAGAGNDEVNGNAGTDTEVLGPGADFASWDPGEGNDTVIGGRGRDRLTFRGSDGDEALSVAPLGDTVILLRSLGDIRMDLTGLEIVDLAARGGADTVAVNSLDGTAVDRVNVDLSTSTGQPDGAADVVTVNGTETPDGIDVGVAGPDVAVDGLRPVTVIHGGQPNDTLEVRALGGEDTVDVADAAEALMAVIVDLGVDD